MISNSWSVGSSKRSGTSSKRSSSFVEIRLRILLGVPVLLAVILLNSLVRLSASFVRYSSSSVLDYMCDDSVVALIFIRFTNGGI